MQPLQLSPKAGRENAPLIVGAGLAAECAELYPEPVLTAIGQAYFLDRTVQVNGATYRLFLPGIQ